MMFKDHFSNQSHLYAEHRPTYPSELFEYLSQIAQNNDLAWDCATGNGQAAIELAKYFKKVVATDASKNQIDNAGKGDNIKYLVCRAEKTSLEKSSVDLITVAQALHWFNLDKFFKEADRVLKQGGILAAWTYNLFKVDKDIDKVINYFYNEIVGKYWPTERKHVENEYTQISIPFKLIKPPEFKIDIEWTRKELLNYLYTWSSVQHYIKKNSRNPLELISQSLESVWEDEDEQKKITWNITIKISKK